jgi:hypothetical protein
VARVVDGGAIFAGWVGFGMSVVVAIGLALVIAIQSLVFLFAPVGGLLIGYYANARSGRRRPLQRALVNAVYAGLVTAVSLTLLYGAIRLLFVYADTGYPDFNRTDSEGRIIEPTCPVGPACTYARYVKAGRGDELVPLGVSDARSFESYALREQLNGSVALLVLTLGGSIVGGAFYALAGSPARRPAPRAGEA